MAYMVMVRCDGRYDVVDVYAAIASYWNMKMLLPCVNNSMKIG